jgi:NADH dehydrogenase FAD-containing subunit
VHRRDRLIDKADPKVSEYVRKFLATRGVNIILNEEVEVPAEGIDHFQGQMHDYRLLPNKANLSADFAFWCTGATPNTAFMRKYFKDALGPKGHINTNEFFQVKESDGKIYQNIFTAGDCSGWVEEKMAERALYHANILSSSISNLVRNEELGNPYTVRFTSTQLFVEFCSQILCHVLAAVQACDDDCVTWTEEWSCCIW